MNKTIVSLAATAAVLAAGAVYLSLQVDAARARTTMRSAPSPATSVPSQASEPRLAPVVNAMPVAVGASSTDSRTQRGPASTNEDRSTRQRRQAAEYLRRLEDQAGRAGARTMALEAARRYSAGLERRANLTSDQYERLVQLLADQEMDKRLKQAKCMVNPACVDRTPDQASAWAAQYASRRDQAIRDIIGDEGLRELRNGRVTEIERRIVAGLQSRLPSTAGLTTEQAEGLTRALVEENHLQQRQLAERDQHWSYYSLRDGPTLHYDNDAPTAELALQSGEASAQAMRERGATVLTGDQLMAYNRMYDDLLIEFRRHIRFKYQSSARNGGRAP